MSDGPAAVIVNEAGTNIAEVKGASTAAVAADKALVVAISPNNTVPVSAVSLPLPTGAATSALQTQPGVDIGDVTVNNAAGAAAVNVQDGGNSITVDAVSLPLPTGAATEATLALIKAKTDNLDVALSTRAVTGLTDAQLRATPVPVSGTVTADAGTGPWPVTDNGGSLTVDGTVAVSGSVAVTGPLTDAQLRAVAVPVSAASLPLPTGAATETTLAAVSGKLPATLGQKAMVASLAVVVASDQSAVPISAAALPLPAGAATEATLGSINTKTLAAGQAAMAASSPVVIASDQSAVPVTANAGTNLNTSALALETTLSATSAKLPATLGQKAMAASLAVVVASDQSTLPVSAASLPLPTGAATETTLATVSAKLPATLGQKAMAASLAVVLASDQAAVPVTANAGTNLNTSALALDATLTGGTARAKVTDGVNNAAVKAASTAPVAGDPALVVTMSPNSPVSSVTGTVTANAGTNLNTSALNLEATQAAISAKLPATLGQKAMAASFAVVLASDQSSIQVTQAAGPGTTPNISFGDVALAAITTAAIRRTAYTEQTVNFTGSILSANVNDTAAGTGARTVKIYYVDATGATAGTETVTLNGTTPVNLVTATKCFIEKMEVLTVGSGLANAGILTLKAGAAGAGATIGTIGAGDNQTFWAHHYVVTGQSTNVTGILVGSNVTNTAGSCVGFLRSIPLGVTNQVEKQISDFIIVAGLDSAVYRSYVSQIRVVGPARVTMYVTTATGSAFNYRGSFDAYDS